MSRTLDPDKIYIECGIGLSDTPSVDIDIGYIGYKGIGKAQIPYSAYEEMKEKYKIYSPSKVLELCIIHSQYIEFKEIENGRT